MLDHIQALDNLTMNMVSRLDACTFEELAAFVHERGAILSRIEESATHLTEANRGSIARILSFDVVLQTRMEQLRDEARSELTKFSNAHRTRGAYGGGTYIDSVFVDRKK